MKRNCLLQNLSYPRDVNEKNGMCYKSIKSAADYVKILSVHQSLEKSEADSVALAVRSI